MSDEILILTSLIDMTYYENPNCIISESEINGI